MAPQIDFASVGRMTLRSNIMEKKELTRNGKGWHSRQKEDHVQKQKQHDASRAWKDLEEFTLPRVCQRNASGDNKSK